MKVDNTLILVVTQTKRILLGCRSTTSQFFVQFLDFHISLLVVCQINLRLVDNLNIISLPFFHLGQFFQNGFELGEPLLRLFFTGESQL